jgi:hypothetical protein
MNARISTTGAMDECIVRMRPVVKEASSIYRNGKPVGLAFIGSKIFEIAMAEKEKGKLVPNTVIDHWEAALAVAKEMKLPDLVMDIAGIVSALSSKRR